LNYYERHIGDYLKDTAHLSLMEHGVYSRLLDVYYTREDGIPQGDSHRLVGARSRDERAAVDTVLREYFRLADGVWRQERCDREIARYLEKQAKARAAAEASWSESGRNARASAKQTTNADAKPMRTHSEGNATRAPVPSLQTPDTSNQTPTSQPKAAQVGRASAPPRPPDVTPQVWADWSALRRSKKAPVTQTVVDGAIAEAKKAGMTLDAFLAEWCQRGSQGLKADWLVGRNGASAVPSTAARDAEAMRLLGFKAGEIIDA
jgi:uncharacterized protein YdaU (DUF1376 family)